MDNKAVIYGCSIADRDKVQHWEEYPSIEAAIESEEQNSLMYSNDRVVIKVENGTDKVVARLEHVVEVYVRRYDNV